MRKSTIAVVIACAAAFGLLSSSTAQPGPPPHAPAHGYGGGAMTFVVPLGGDQEVPPFETDSFGLAIFNVRPNQSAIHYTLITSPMPDITMAHIHMAPAGVNGPVVVWLFGEPGNIPPTPNAGLLARGIIAADDLVGQLEGEPLSVLIDLMLESGAYVNVHTSTSPAGEIRGQIALAGN